MENASGTIVAKRLDTSERSGAQTTKGLLPSANELLGQKPTAEGKSQLQGQVNNSTIRSGQGNLSALKSITVGRKGFSAQDKVFV